MGRIKAKKIYFSSIVAALIFAAVAGAIIYSSANSGEMPDVAPPHPGIIAAAEVCSPLVKVDENLILTHPIIYPDAGSVSGGDRHTNDDVYFVRNPKLKKWYDGSEIDLAGSDSRVEVVRKYDFYSSVPESEKADAAYFADALFIGDSRTQGIALYSGVKSTYFADVGLNILGALNKAFIDNGNGGKSTVLEAVKANPVYKKVYISFGINEINWPAPSVFVASYSHIIDELILLLPDAEIYVQGIVPVSHKTDESGYIKNSRIDDYNKLLSDMAAEKGVYYLNVTEIYDDSDGFLPSEISSDGIHLNRSGVQTYIDYLLSHIVTEE